jgi:hypothetical protein
LNSRPAITRTNPDHDITEEISYFGVGPQMFSCLHLPRGDVRAAVVICSSTHAELLKAYHLEVQLARELAASGIAVQRFQYRGDGNSEGSDTDLTLPAMISASREALERVVDRTGTTKVSFMGVRMGAFPAATIAADSPGGSLLLWDPVLDADVFMREAIRSHAISALKGEGKPEKVDKVLERLATEGSVELLGFEVSSAFHSSIAGKKLVDCVPTGSTVLIVPFGSLNTEPLTTAWTAAGVSISDLQGTGRQAWWLEERASVDSNQRGRTLVERSAEWLTAAATGV